MSVKILVGDCRAKLAELPDKSVQCCVTSPPYFGLRNYNMPDQIGLESTPDEFVAELVQVFREVRRVLRDDGTVWLNLGDSYNAAGRVGHGTIGHKQSTNVGTIDAGDHRNTVSGLKEKDLIGIPWRVAFALQADGWYLRQDIIWAKPNPMPESVRDRCTKAHEYVFLLSKSAQYHYDADAIAERSAWQPGETSEVERERGYYGGKWSEAGNGRNDGSFKAIRETRNKRSVWTVATRPYKGAHFATFPPELIEPCILAGCPAGGVVLDPFGGAGTTAVVASKLGRDAVLIELNPDYAAMAQGRVRGALGACEGAGEPDEPAGSLFA